jgi:hypothetical protein
MPETQPKTTVVIRPDGAITFIHDDDLRPFVNALGAPEIRRASCVEPTPGGRWTADMAPVAGPVLGPFDTRREALAAERAWLLDANLPFPAESGD